MRASEHGGYVPSSVGYWSFNGAGNELWANDTFGTKDEAVAEGRAHFDSSEPFEVGQIVEADVCGPDAIRALEQVSEWIYEQCGETAEDFLNDVTKEAAEELDEVLSGAFASWLTKHDLWPRFCKIGNIERVEPLAPPADTGATTGPV